MAVTNQFYFMLAGCALVTWLPRIIPFLLAKKITFPKIVLDFLEYVPLCILFALLIDTFFTVQEGKVPQIAWLKLMVGVPTILIAVRTKDLMKTVLFGVLAMAIFRWIL